MPTSQPVRRKLADELRKIPSISGSGYDAGQTYVTQRLSRVLARAEQEAGKLKDEYVSIEHVLIAMLDESGRDREDSARSPASLIDKLMAGAAEGPRQPARDLGKS